MKQVVVPVVCNGNEIKGVVSIVSQDFSGVETSLTISGFDYPLQKFTIKKPDGSEVSFMGIPINDSHSRTLSYTHIPGFALNQDVIHIDGWITVGEMVQPPNRTESGLQRMLRGLYNGL